MALPTVTPAAVIGPTAAIRVVCAAGATRGPLGIIRRCRFRPRAIGGGACVPFPVNMLLRETSYDDIVADPGSPPSAPAAATFVNGPSSQGGTPQ